VNQLATNTERLPMDSVGMSTGSTGAKIAPQNLAEVVKFAEVMCRADIALPKHLRGNAGACMAVALQALDWQMNPFAVAGKSYQVNGTIAYEAQLIAAVVNTRSGIKGRLRYAYEGTGNDMTCTVTGTLDGQEYAYTSPPIGAITPKNSPLWKTDPQQQLGYFSARSWARRYTPEVILGVYDREEAEQFQGPDNAKDITPAQPSVMARLKAAQEAPQHPASEREGFDASFVHSETESALMGETISDTPSDDAASPAGTSDADDIAPASSSATEEAEVSPSASASSTPIDADLRQHLMDFARKASKTVEDGELSDEVKASTIDDMIANYREVVSETQWGKLSTIKVSLQAVLTGKRTMEQARKFIASDLLDCTVEEIGG
jgi:RecT family